MFVTGRLPLLLALGALPLVLITSAIPAATASGDSGAVAWGVVAAWLLVCAIVVVVDVVAASDPRQLEVSRDLPARTRLGEPAAAVLTVTNRGSRRLRGLLRDAWQPTAGAPAERARLDVAAGDRQTIGMTLIPRRRGELRSEFTTVRSLGPLGIAGRQATLPAPGRLRVLPPFRSRRHLPSRLARLRELDGMTSVQIRGQGTEFDSLREYVRGDDVRSIDWRATARARSTMLRTWRPERDRHVVIVIDTGRTSAGRVGDETRLDAAMEATLLLAALADAAGDHVHVVLVDRVVRGRVTGRRGAALLPALVDAMSSVEPQLIDTDWHTALNEAARMTHQPALTVLVTALDAASASRALLGALPRLTSRGRVIVASVTDEKLAVMADDRESSDALWTAAAAERAIEDARRLSAAIRSLGAEALSDSPAELPPRVADRYLELKAAGRL